MRVRSGYWCIGARRTYRAATLASLVVLAALAFGGAGVQPAAAAEEGFGFEGFSFRFTEENGLAAVRAGSHPFKMVVSFSLKHHTTESEEQDVDGGRLKTVSVDLPAGVIINPTATPTLCTEDAIVVQQCPLSAAVGVALLEIAPFPLKVPVPVYNMVPPAGAPAMLAFTPEEASTVHLIGHVRTGGDYGLTSDAPELTQKGGVLAATVELWGDPASSAHDSERGQCELPTSKEHGSKCPVDSCGFEANGQCPKQGQADPSFISLPSECSGPLTARVHATIWEEPSVIHEVTAQTTNSEGNPVGIEECSRLDFSPQFSAKPSSTAAETPTGLAVDVRVPQNEGANGLAEANLEDTTVKLPAGVTVSPSAANGLAACSPQQISLGDASVPSCPEASKVGVVEIHTPLLHEPLKGAVYLAQQNNNPFGSLLAVYLVAEGSGAIVKIAGHVEADPQTGQLTTTFQNSPQLPFSDLKVDFFGGPRASLVTPAVCGAYQSGASFSPWSATPTVDLGDSFSIVSGCGAPFAPQFSAGTEKSRGGAFSPFSVTVTRPNGQPHLESIAVHTPRGLLGVLKSVSQCPEPQASQGACGPQSLIGHTTTAAGPGPEPFSVGGSVFLTGPYRGAPFGLSIVVHALAGPFDLGNVIVRAAIAVDPSTAALSVTSDPLPTILQGIPLDIQWVNVTVDRPGFMFNPTNCEPQHVDGSIASVENATVAVSSFFEATNCATLPFKPSFSVFTAGRSSKANGVSLDVKVSSKGGPQPGGGEANIRMVHVALPKQLPSRLTTIQKACLAATFEANPASCPAASDIGSATATTPLLNVPLSGPAFLVSHGGAAFPDLEIVLQGERITIVLDGSIDIKKGVTSSTFKSIPDAPITSFELKLPTGPYSALAANTPTGPNGTFCHTKLIMPTTITGQNGAIIKQNTRIAVTGCAKAKKARKGRRKASHTRGTVSFSIAATK
jgi:hypothetical protein